MGSVQVGNPPNQLATALYKLVYSNSRATKEAVQEAGGLKAFFVNDPSNAWNEVNDLRQIDQDKNGVIDSADLMALRSKKIHVGLGNNLKEIFSTHPNMLKRIKQLSMLTAG